MDVDGEAKKDETKDSDGKDAKEDKKQGKGRRFFYGCHAATQLTVRFIFIVTFDLPTGRRQQFCLSVN